MAEKKNFIIENFNGTDYDTLYPETNSGQVLLDTTAQAATTLPSGSTLNDALNKLNKFDNRYEIGDVLTTSRTDLSDKWLLCNGATLNDSDYPELGSQLPGVEMVFNKISVNSQTTEGYNQYSIATRKTASTTSAIMIIYANVYYCNSLSGGTWVSWGTLPQSCYVKTLNNHYVIVSTIQSGSAPFAKYCIGEPTSLDSFSNLQLPSNVSVYNYGDCIYCNNRYYFAYNGVSDAKMFRVLMYTDLQSAPTKDIAIPILDAPFYTGNGGTGYIFGIVDGNATLSCYRSNQDSDPSYVSDFVSIDSNGAATLLNKSTQLYRTNVPLSAWSLGGKYYIIRSPLSSQRYWTINVMDSLQSTSSTELKQIRSNYGQLCHFWLVENDKIILPDKTYIDSNGVIKNWNSGPSGSTLCLSFSSTDTDIYAMYPKYEVWASSKSAQFNLPIYSPATGLRAYIKAKN